MILGGFSCELGSIKSVYSLDTTKCSIKKMEKDLEQPGWSIYHPIRQGKNINVFYGGEEGYPPHHLIYEII